jgi:hypothetical protein
MDWRAGESSTRGMGVTVGRSLHRTWGRTGRAGAPKPTSLRGIAFSQTSGIAEAVSSRSPVRKNRTPGSVRGALGNWRPYRDDVEGILETCKVL